MKSAYELAMERLEEDEPVVKISDEQKAALAELDKSYAAKIAEKEIFLQGKLAAAPAEEHADIEKQLVNERLRLEEERDTKKEQIRSGE